jgi:hypothetical protein
MFDHWELNGTNVGTITTYIVTMNANYANNNTVRSKIARIVVSPFPVGGYAISLAKGTSTLTFQTAIYTTLIILFGLMLSLTKRKRK